jgi:hypothetical protein
LVFCDFVKKVIIGSQRRAARKGHLSLCPHRHNCPVQFFLKSKAKNPANLRDSLRFEWWPAGFETEPDSDHRLGPIERNPVEKPLNQQSNQKPNHKVYKPHKTAPFVNSPRKVLRG